MIVFGAKSSQIASETLIDRCPNCRMQANIIIHIIQKFGHICWIPIFPAGKTAINQCTNCNQVFNFNEMPNSLKIVCANLRKQTKTPVWVFSGWALAAVIAIAYVYVNKQREINNAKLILTPKSGDIYEVKTEEAQYTLYKIEQVQGDSVFIHYNNYVTDDESGIDNLKAKGDTAYEAEVAGFSKAELKRMFVKGEILNIIR